MIYNRDSVIEWARRNNINFDQASAVPPDGWAWSVRYGYDSELEEFILSDVWGILEDICREDIECF